MRKLLKNYKGVDAYIDYVNNLITDKNSKGELKNKWAKHQKKEDYARVFKLCYDKTGLLIDGDTILLQYRGKLAPMFTYQAYVNLVLKNYPESKFDYSLVYDSDEFSF